MRRFPPILLGNTADRVIRTVRLPCLLSSGTLSAEPTRILVALDRSAHARRAFRVAADFAAVLRRSGGGDNRVTIHLLNVSAYAAGRSMPDRYIDLASIATRLAAGTGAGVEVTHSTRSAAVPADGIVDFSEEYGPDLVVMGTHGVGRVVRALIGSVALDVARTLPLPLLLVPPPARRPADQPALGPGPETEPRGRA